MISAKDGRVGKAPRKNGKTLDRRNVILGLVLMATGWQAFAQDGLFNYQEYEKRVKSAQILAVKLLMPIVLLLGLPALPGIAFGGESQALRGTYSNLCIHPDTGDVLGIELSFVSEAEGGYVLVQRYEGGPLAPELMKIKSRGDLIVLAVGESDSIALQRKGSVVRATYLDGQQSRLGTAVENLISSSPVWQGQKPAVCRYRHLTRLPAHEMKVIIGSACAL